MRRKKQLKKPLNKIHENHDFKSLSVSRSPLSSWIYAYRFDVFSVVIMVAVTMYYVEVLFRPGQIVFSDIDFPFKSDTYLDEVFGIWNTKWNTTSMLNVPRLLVLMPSFILSQIFGGNGNLFLKSFVVQNLLTSGLCFYLLCKRLVSINISPSFNLSRIFVIIFGSIYYALNPWVIFRIQHIFLLVGYSLFPLTMLLFLKIFDHKFQRVAIKGFNPFSRKIYGTNIRDIIFLAYVITVSSAAIHYFFYTVLLLGALFGLLILKYLIKYRNEENNLRHNMWINLSKKIMLLASVFVGFSFYWLYVYVASILFQVQASQNNVNVIDTYVAFSRHSSIKDVLYLISYWWPMIDMRQIPISFYFGGGAILLISVVGLIAYMTKRHIILFMGIVAGVLIILGTGVYYTWVAKAFLALTGLPIIGTIFRDPNKLVGLAAMFLGVFFVFGLEILLNQGDRLNKYRLVYIYSIIACAGICLILYILPMKYLYVEHFYAPIEEPDSYEELREYYDDGEAHYGIYLPLSDEMTQPYSHVSTPYWNINSRRTQSVAKATGDVHIYNSPIPTLFQFEGNDPAIAYFYNYIQYLLDQGRSDQVSVFVKAFGANQLIYHDEYEQQYYRQDFNKRVLNLDEDLEPTFTNDIFTIFDLGYTIAERNSNKSFIDWTISTPYGFERTAIYEAVGIYRPLLNPVIYLNQEQRKNEEMAFDSLDKSMVEAKNEQDLIFSLLPSSFYLYPFDWTDQGNVFLGWTKTYLSSVDWSWYLSSQDMQNRSFEFDQGKGVAVTFASNHLAIEPYLRNQIKGKLILDFDTMLRTENMFVADNPDMFEINANPYSDIEKFQTLHGELVKGDPKNIWQVAKSGILPAKGGTPYHFDLLLSGRDVDRLHLKVRFYNENNEEIGVSYIVASSQESYFDSIKFVGEVISPSETTHMRMDLLSYQNLNFKSYWWIHDINIYDLSQYVEANQISGEYEAVEDGEYSVYVRTFDSYKGGLLEVEVANNGFEIGTLDEGKNTFTWHYLGEIDLNRGSHPVNLIGKDGFNCVNAIVIVPKSDYDSAKKRVEEKLDGLPIIMSYESSIDLDYSGNIQSKRIYPTLSLGRGIALEDGVIEGGFDIMANGQYYFHPKLMYVDGITGYGDLKIYREGQLIKSWRLGDRIKTNESAEVVDYMPERETYAYEFIDIRTPYTYEDQGGYRISLEQGHYTFEIDLHSQTPSKSSIEKIQPFDTSIIRFLEEDVQKNSLGSCERISPDMMNEEIVDSSLLITLDPTCSTDWYSYGSNLMDVSVNEEYLIRFDARSELLLNRHSKVLFLDDENNFVGNVYISEVEQQYKERWNHYEQLVVVPDRATKMVLQFLGNGDRKEYSTLEIKDFDVFNYNEFILLDHLFIENEEAMDQRVSTISVMKSQIVRTLNQTTLTYSQGEGNLGGDRTLNTFLSPNKNWVIGGKSSDYLLNGITQGFDLPSSKEYKFKLLLAPGYIFGIVLHLLTVLICSVCLLYRRKNY